MGILSALLGVKPAKAIDAVGNTLDALFTSSEEKAQAAIVMERLRQQPHLLQAEINKLEATHRTMFVAGWRPFIGWVCGVGLAWQFIGHPFAEWGVALAGLDAVPPQLDRAGLMSLTTGMLGLGGLRTYEKLRDKTK